MVLAGERGADRRREQQGHSPGLALVPSADQALRVLKHRASVARLAAASASALALRSASILRRVKPMPGWSAKGVRVQSAPAIRVSRGPNSGMNRGRTRNRKNYVNARRNRGPFWIWKFRGLDQTQFRALRAMSAFGKSRRYKIVGATPAFYTQGRYQPVSRILRCHHGCASRCPQPPDQVFAGFGFRCGLAP